MFTYNHGFKDKISRYSIFFKRTNPGIHVSELVQFDRFGVVKLVDFHVNFCYIRFMSKHHAVYKLVPLEIYTHLQNVGPYLFNIRYMKIFNINTACVLLKQPQHFVCPKLYNGQSRLFNNAFLNIGGLSQINNYSGKILAFPLLEICRSPLINIFYCICRKLY